MYDTGPLLASPCTSAVPAKTYILSAGREGGKVHCPIARFGPESSPCGQRISFLALSDPRCPHPSPIRYAMTTDMCLCRLYNSDSTL